jgi:hypothetical protein
MDKRWGAIPQGFAKITDPQGNQLLVRQDLAGQIDFSLCAANGGDAESFAYQGRAPIRARKLRNGEIALIRSYRHGGLLRALTEEWFFTWPPRPFRELAITEELRRRGVPTVEVLAACVSQGTGPFYRGWLVTRQLAGAEDFWSALQSGFVGKVGLEATLRAVAESGKASTTTISISKIFSFAWKTAGSSATSSISTKRNCSWAACRSRSASAISSGCVARL